MDNPLAINRIIKHLKKPATDRPRWRIIERKTQIVIKKGNQNDRFTSDQN